MGTKDEPSAGLFTWVVEMRGQRSPAPHPPSSWRVVQYFHLQPVHFETSDTQSGVDYGKSLHLHKISAYPPPFIPCRGEERGLARGAAWTSCSYPGPRRPALLCLSVRSMPINYREHSKMINAFYLSLRKSMAPLRPR